MRTHSLRRLAGKVDQYDVRGLLNAIEKNAFAVGRDIEGPRCSAGTQIRQLAPRAGLEMQREIERVTSCRTTRAKSLCTHARVQTSTTPCIPFSRPSTIAT